MIEIRKARSLEDIQGILTLQKKNSKSANLSYDDMPDGFVTIQHDPEKLKTMIETSPQIVAVNHGKVVGYTLSFLPRMGHLFPEITPMMSEFKDIKYKGKKLVDTPFVIGGQCCIDTSHRGQNLLSRLYHGTRDEMHHTHAYCVTEVAHINPRSLRAHLKIGFEVVHTYEAPDHIWDVILWDWQS